MYKKKLFIHNKKIYVEKQTNILSTIPIKNVYLEQKIYLDNNDLILYNFSSNIDTIDLLNKNLINIYSNKYSIWNNEKLYNFKLSHILPLNINKIWNT